MKKLVFAIAGLAWLVASAVSLAQTGDEPAPAEVLADLSENNLSAEEIQGELSPSSVRVVSLETFSGQDLQMLEETLRETEDGFAEVQSAIERNEAFEAVLKDRNIPISSVVAATRSESGAITIYIEMPEN